MPEAVPENLYPRYRFGFTVLFAVLLFGLFWAALVFGEPFLFWVFPLSDLGATVTENGFENGRSVVIFASDMIACAVVMSVIGVFFLRDRGVRHRSLRVTFSFTCALGFLIAAFPHDIFSAQHTFGSAFMVGSLWFHSVLFLEDIRFYRGRAASLRHHFVLQSTVLSYAVAYVLDAPIKQVLQKFAVLGLSVVLLSSTNALSKLSEELDALGDLDNLTS